MSIDTSASEAMLRVSASTGNLPKRWSWGRLEDVCEGVYDCPHSTPKLTATGPYVVRTQDILSGVFMTDSAAHVSEETYLERITRVTPRRGDLLYSREGTYFGIAAEVPPDVRVCLGQRMVLIRPDKALMDFRFMRYWLNSPLMATYIHGFRDGSVAERLNLPTIRSLPVLIPSVSGQAAIADILGALDGKIAVNDQVADSSRNLAISIGQRLFLRGGWKEVYLGDYSDIAKGLSYRSVDLGIGTCGLVSLKCVGRAGDFQPAGVKLYGGEYKSTQIVDEGDIVVAQTDLTQRVEVIGRPVRVLNLSGFSKLIASLDLVIVRPLPPLSREVILSLLSTDEFHEHALAYCNGTTVVHMASKALPEFKFYLPKPDAIRSVTAEMVPLLAQSDQARRENQTLADLRDTLLPKLMSGKICVRDAEKVVEDVTLWRGCRRQTGNISS